MESKEIFSYERENGGYKINYENGSSEFVSASEENLECILRDSICDKIRSRDTVYSSITYKFTSYFLYGLSGYMTYGLYLNEFNNLGLILIILMSISSGVLVNHIGNKEFKETTKNTKPTLTNLFKRYHDLGKYELYLKYEELIKEYFDNREDDNFDKFREEDFGSLNGVLNVKYRDVKKLVNKIKRERNLWY